MFRMAVCAVLALVGPVLGGPLNKNDVPADVKWLAHGDVEGFVASKVGTFMLDELKKQGLNDALEKIQEAFTFNPVKDLKGVTIFGRQYSDQHVVALIRVKVDKPTLVERLKGNQTFKESTYGDHTVMQWTDNPEAEKPGGTKYMSFYRDDFVVMGQNLGEVKHALDVLDKKSESLGKSDNKAFPTPAKGSFLMACVGEAPEIPKGKPEAALLGKFASACLDVGETNDRMQARLAVTARTERAATNLRKIADGFLAFLDLAQDIEKEGKDVLPAELTALLKDVKVSQDDKTVIVEASPSAQSVISFLKWAIKQQKAKPAPKSSEEKVEK